MFRRFILAVCLSAGLLFVAPLTHAGGRVQVNEDKTQLSLTTERVAVTLDLSSSLNARINALVTVEIIDTEDRVLASIQEGREIQRGHSTITLTFPSLGNRIVFGGEDILWYRLRYRIAAPGSTAADIPITSGLVSLS